MRSRFGDLDLTTDRDPNVSVAKEEVEHVGAGYMYFYEFP